ncbi:MAG: hypothetical protein WKI46_00230 [Aquificaceae bacterium]
MEIISAPIEEEVKQSYIDYAMSVIVLLFLTSGIILSVNLDMVLAESLVP